LAVSFEGQPSPAFPVKRQPLKDGYGRRKLLAVIESGFEQIKESEAVSNLEP
jgi:hypothetical protein